MSADDARTHTLCAVDEIAEPGSRGFEIDTDGEQPLRVFVVRKDGVLACYRNRCPHTGAPLEWLPDQFLDLDNSFIQCAIHGALFQLKDGLCLHGPCSGRSLQPVSIIMESGVISIK